MTNYYVQGSLPASSLHFPWIFEIPWLKLEIGKGSNPCMLSNKLHEFYFLFSSRNELKTFKPHKLHIKLLLDFVYFSINHCWSMRFFNDIRNSSSFFSLTFASNLLVDLHRIYDLEKWFRFIQINILSSRLLLAGFHDSFSVSRLSLLYYVSAFCCRIFAWKFKLQLNLVILNLSL